MSTEVAPPVVDGVEWVRPRPPRRALRNDAWLALLLAGCTAASVALYRATGYGEDAQWWASALWVLGMTLPLAARRVQPEVVAVVLAAVFMVGGIAEVGELLFCQIALFAAIYTVGAWGRSRLRASVVRGVIVAAMFVWLLWVLVFFSAVQDYLPDLDRTADGWLSPYVAYGLINVVLNLLYFGGAWYFGDAAYRSARARAALQQRTDELSAERERTRAQAVAIERLRIARELHDVVAHHVSVIGVQAGAARRVVATDAAGATAALSTIEHSAREAVDELHGLLGTLRADTGALAITADADADARTDSPARGLDDVGSLARESEANGVPTTFSVVGEPRSTPATIGTNAYRVVQEALTNVRKHAGAAAVADVRVRWSDDAVEVEVANSGVTARVDSSHAGSNARADEQPAPNGGLGQLGMRERVAASGGTIELGPRSRGGYLVRARFPLRRVDGVAR